MSWAHSFGRRCLLVTKSTTLYVVDHHLASSTRVHSDCLAPSHAVRSFSRSCTTTRDEVDHIICRRPLRPFSHPTRLLHSYLAPSHVVRSFSRSSPPTTTCDKVDHIYVVDNLAILHDVFICALHLLTLYACSLGSVPPIRCCQNCPSVSCFDFIPFLFGSMASQSTNIFSVFQQ